MTIDDVPGPVTDALAGDLLRRCGAASGGPAVPVSVESIAEDPLGLRLLEAAELGCSGPLVPAERRISGDGARPAHQPEEREANVLAAELLMPEPAVSNEFRPGDSVAEMAARFDVSQEALHWRLFNVVLLGQQPS